MNLRKHLPTHAALLLLFTGSLQAQTKKTGNGPSQLQKGRWMISHKMFSIAPYKYENTYYDQDNKITYRYKGNSTNFSLLFYGPDWGSIGGGGNKTEDFDAANNQTRNGDNSSFNFYLNPSAGYFIQDRLMLGAQLTLGYYSGNTDYFEPPVNRSFERKYKQFSAGIGPEIRYYFGNTVSRQLFHAGISSVFSTGKSTDGYTYTTNNQKTTTNSENKSTYYSITPYIGSSWKLGKRWLLESTLFSTTGSNKTESELVSVLNNITNSSRSSSNNKSNYIIGLRAGFSYTF